MRYSEHQRLEELINSLEYLEIEELKEILRLLSKWIAEKVDEEEDY